MHWRAIQCAIATYEGEKSVADRSGLRLDGNNSRNGAGVVAANRFPALPGGDDACDIKAGLLDASGGPVSELDRLYGTAGNHNRTITQPLASEIRQRAIGWAAGPASDNIPTAASTSRSSLTEHNLRSLNSSFAPGEDFNAANSNADAEHSHTASTYTQNLFVQDSIPSEPANDLAPFAYQRALRNRIQDDELSKGRKYDIKAYMPMFVHDCLMMPGSMSNIRGKGSAEDVVRRMTPAFLPGFCAHVHATTHEPLLLQSSNPGDYVQGMLIFGQSKDVRHKIHEHYRPSHKKIKAEVELDTVHPVPSHLRAHCSRAGELRRRSVWAHVWIWKNAHSGDAGFQSQRGDPGWRFDDYLAGKYTPIQSLRIEPAGWIEDDRETDRTKDGTNNSPIGGAVADNWQATSVGPSDTWEEASVGEGAVVWDDNA